jgi:hypothetical protein
MQPNLSTGIGFAEDVRNALLAQLVSTFLQHPELCVFKLTTGESVDLRHLLTPEIQLPYNRSEIRDVAKFFRIRFDEIPCLIFFRDLEAAEIWALSLAEIGSVHQAAIYFRRAFGSEKFRKILDDARHFSQSATG